jgi:hypothetical protein
MMQKKGGPPAIVASYARLNTKRSITAYKPSRSLVQFGAKD